MSGNTTPVPTEGWTAVTEQESTLTKNTSNDTIDTSNTTHVVLGGQEKITQSSLNVEEQGDETILNKDSTVETIARDESGVETFNQKKHTHIQATFPHTPINNTTVNNMDKMAKLGASEPTPEQSLFARVWGKIKAPFVYAGQKISDGYQSAQSAYFNFLDRHPRLKSAHDTVRQNIVKITLAVVAVVGAIFLFKNSPKAASAAQSAVNGVTDAAASARDGLYNAGGKASEKISSAATSVSNSVKGAGESVRKMLFSSGKGTPPAAGASTVPTPSVVESTVQQTTRVVNTPGLR